MLLVLYTVILFPYSFLPVTPCICYTLTNILVFPICVFQQEEQQTTTEQVSLSIYIYLSYTLLRVAPYYNFTN